MPDGDFFQSLFRKRKKQPIGKDYAIANPDEPEVQDWLKKLDNSTVMDKMMAKRIRELQTVNKLDKQGLAPQKLYPFVGRRK